MSSEKLKTIDLFAGMGGLGLGFSSVGFETVFANDCDKWCKITYDKNTQHAKLTLKSLYDVTAEEIPPYDILLGGFPCQPFSSAGPQKGFEDARGTLIFEVVRLLRETRPKAFLLENVLGILSHNKGQTFAVILDTLQNDLGYFVKYAVLDTQTHANLPQHRKRVFMVGFLDKKHYDAFTFPEKIPLTVTLKDVFEETVDDDSFYYKKNTVTYSRLEPIVTKRYTTYKYHRSYRIEEKKGNVCNTLRAAMGLAVNSRPIILDARGIRQITPRECARLQGFPENFDISGIPKNQIYRQLGNAVTYTLAQRLGQQMLLAFNA